MGQSSWIRYLSAAGLVVFLILLQPHVRTATGSVFQQNAIFVANWAAETSRVYRLDTASRGLIPIRGGLDNLRQGTCGPDGYLYFAESGQNRIVRISQNGQHVETVYTTSGRGLWDTPQAPTFGPDGALYFTNTGRGGLWRLDLDGAENDALQVVKGFGIQGDLISGKGVAFLKAAPFIGHVLIASLEERVVYRISPDDFCQAGQTENCGLHTPFLTYNNLLPSGIAISDNGDIYVSYRDNQGTQSPVVQYSADGALINAWDRGVYFGQIAVDSFGKVWGVASNGIYSNITGNFALASSITTGTGLAICSR
jgi:hypothetical protein